MKVVGKPFVDEAKMHCRGVTVRYGDKLAIKDVTLDIGKHEVLALIGPSGCGKSTFLRCLNRMNDTIPDCHVTGTVFMDGQDIYNGADPVLVRARIGMVFQKPNPFPKSIYENIAYGPRIHRMAKTRDQMDEIVENSLKRAGLWDEVYDRLTDMGTSLSGGQQQRLCIARAISIDPEILLMDEPCSALDPIATGVIEELIKDLRKKYSIVIVTHSMSQAKRVSQRTGYFHMGDLIEIGTTEKIFGNPKHELTEHYINGHFG